MKTNKLTEFFDEYLGEAQSRINGLIYYGKKDSLDLTFNQPADRLEEYGNRLYGLFEMLEKELAEMSSKLEALEKESIKNKREGIGA